MSIGPAARTWFSKNFKNDGNKVYTSKFFSAEESWPKTRVWWFKIPPSAIDSNHHEAVNLICQDTKDGAGFIYLRVPTSFFQKHMKAFHMLGDKLSIYLSAEPGSRFLEVRGKGQLDFSSFIINREEPKGS